MRKLNEVCSQSHLFSERTTEPFTRGTVPTARSAEARSPTCLAVKTDQQSEQKAQQGQTKMNTPAKQ
jgi:hypothetical protein